LVFDGCINYETKGKGSGKFYITQKYNQSAKDENNNII